MLCPRCDQDRSVAKTGDAWVCHACSMTFTENTQVIRAIVKNAVWVEKGTGSLVRIVGLDGDPFDTLTAVRYRSDTSDALRETTQTMLARDFRFYFRPHDRTSARLTTPIPCKPKEEWESDQGHLYIVLSVSQQDGTVHLIPAGGSHRSFWVPVWDFVRQFHRFHRKTDYARLLDD